MGKDLNKPKSSISGLISFLAVIIAATIFAVEYFLGAKGYSWVGYLAIARDVAIISAVLFGSMGYIRSKGFIIKLLFLLAMAVYVIFAFLVPLT